jgi:Rrf2 family iron-sulfur cluster assembly transcriptional regulator
MSLLGRQAMKLSTKGRYAMVALADLATARADQLTSLAEVSRRQDISLPYLEQLFVKLRRAGLVESVRGPGGGYRLARTAEETNIAEIVLAVDEPIRATRCGGQGSRKGCMLKGERCLTHDLWDQMGEKIHQYLAPVTRADVGAGRLAASRQAAA